MKLTDFLRDTKGELKHVNWPTQKQSIWFTVIVVVLSLITAIILGFSDFIFSGALDRFVI